jgi:hypothetical protein
MKGGQMPAALSIVVTPEIGLLPPKLARLPSRRRGRDAYIAEIKIIAHHRREFRPLLVSCPPHTWNTADGPDRGFRPFEEGIADNANPKIVRRGRLIVRRMYEYFDFAYR